MVQCLLHLGHGFVYGFGLVCQRFPLVFTFEALLVGVELLPYVADFNDDFMRFGDLLLHLGHEVELRLYVGLTDLRTRVFEDAQGLFLCLIPDAEPHFVFAGHGSGATQ